MKILLTSFLPFNNNEVNYSTEVLKLIISNPKVIKKTLPVDYINSFIILKKFINIYKPNIIILTGEARTYKSVGFETIGENKTGNTKDSNNFVPLNNLIIDNKIDYLFSTLNYKVFEKSFADVNVNQFKSLSAGNYVCNALLYQTLLYIKNNNLNIKCAFIHVPNLKNQAIDDVVKGMNNYIMTLLTNNSI